ncbi:uncharacterized protein N0V89_005334 [Didymosphaeria variabile]|uniref:Uncharacterized protein n=1 Tax=Didymosphaeria variabile TaxID=1932322 RepID=A0A9W9CBD6_9PLEO|nr:uncharacterized protein N0V89_005334 [Didymosphaeria variabile]KAJ4353604.1 hypothetical protein N0V89_005334 [Didymosphaeria variabile]
MSAYRYTTDAERHQARQDHEFVWGVINRDERYLSQLPPGPVMPGTFLHFLQQGDHSDEAMAAFEPEALEIMQSLRRQMEEKYNVDLSEWHAEWVQSEQQQKEWKTPIGPGTSRSLLRQPAYIDLHTHDQTAKGAALDYWGTDEEAPSGALRQKARWAKEAQAATHSGNGSTLTGTPSNSSRLGYRDKLLPEAHSQASYMSGQRQQMKDVHQDPF